MNGEKTLEIVGAPSDLTLSEPREVDDGREMPLIRHVGFAWPEELCSQVPPVV